MRLSELLYKAKLICRRGREFDSDDDQVAPPQRMYRGVRYVRCPNKIRKRLGMAKR